jgi:hypothetical protein
MAASKQRKMDDMLHITFVDEVPRRITIDDWMKMKRPLLPARRLSKNGGIHFQNLWANGVSRIHCLDLVNIGFTELGGAISFHLTVLNFKLFMYLTKGDCDEKAV